MFKTRLKQIGISIVMFLFVLALCFIIVMVGIGGPMWLLMQFGPDIETGVTILYGFVTFLMVCGIGYFLYWLFLEPLINWMKKRKG